MLKRGLAFALALVMLASVSVAGAAWSEVTVDGFKYVDVSDWSKADIEKAMKLKLNVVYTGQNVKQNIARVDFAEDAAALGRLWPMAKTFGPMSATTSYKSC